MIIIDDLDDPSNPDKFSDDARSVVRPSTPTPSLPSYEFSQALQSPPQLLEEQSQSPQTSRGCWPNRTKTSVRRVLVYALVVYFIITVVVGVPVIVISLRHRSMERQSLYTVPTNANTPSLIADGNNVPLLETSAVSCNAWLDSSDTYSSLQYTVPLDGLVFMQSNVSYYPDALIVDDISGSVVVGINTDPTVIDGLVSVTMHYSDQSVRDRTNVCLLNVSGSNGLYLYVPSNLTKQDSLAFNITFLFPQTSSLHIAEFMTMLPHFAQWYANLSTYVTFDKVTLGGPRSQVTVESIDAPSLTVRTALAAIEGSFSASEFLVLETVSAPIDVNISLYNSGTYMQPTFVQVATGNAALNACVQLHLPAAAPQATKLPNFVAKFETFNAPMALAVAHASDSAPSALQLHADNSVGASTVSVDNKYTGDFDISTTFADADVFTSTVTTLEDLTNIDLNGYKPESSPTAIGEIPDRRVELDTIQTSRMTGWVGSGTRPPTPIKIINAQGRVEVFSTLSPVTLLIGP